MLFRHAEAAKVKYKCLVDRKMTKEPKETRKMADEDFYVATTNGVFVIPPRFLPQVLEGINKVEMSTADGRQDSQAS